MSNSVAEIEDAGALFVIGSNTTENHPIIALRMKAAVRKGAQLIVADPRQIPLTKFATLWLRHKPGTDSVLLNAIMHTILREGWEDRKFIESVFGELRRVQFLACGFHTRVCRDDNRRPCTGYRTGGRD